MTNEHLVILGAFLSLLLSLNAYFLNSLVERLTKIEIELMKITTEQHSLSRILDSHEEDIDKLLDQARS